MHWLDGLSSHEYAAFCTAMTSIAMCAFIWSAFPIPIGFVILIILPFIYLMAYKIGKAANDDPHKVVYKR